MAIAFPNLLPCSSIRKKHNFANNKFSLISIQFAIHYFFENEKSLDKLVENIDANLKVGGLFMGTCFDGSIVWDRLKDMAKGEYISEEIANI